MRARFGRRSVVAERRADTIDDEPGRTAIGPPYGVQSPGSSEFEKYEEVAPIGQGGMGEVLLIHDRDLRREVAMKVIRRECAGNPVLRRKFVAEAQATAQLEHPGIPPVHDLGARPDGSLYFTMKVVRGRTLGDVLRDLLLGVKEVRREYTLHRLTSVVERIAEAIEFAHEKGVIHRDLKPSNVMLGSYGEVHVMDWGLAKIAGPAGPADDASSGTGETPVRTDAAESGPPTQAGTIQGTLSYMSPEQARGGPIDRRSDLYALGLLLYEVLTLHRAFEGDGPELLRRVRGAEFHPVETRNPSRPVPEALASLCRRALSEDPALRPATAREFAAELREWMDGRADRERRRREAEALAAHGRDAIARYATAHTAIETTRVEAERLEGAYRPWQSLAEKEPLLCARGAANAARQTAALAFAEATRLLEGALLAEPENPTARSLLADLWKGRLSEAERREDHVDAEFAVTMLRRYDDGRLARFASGDGVLELSSDPPGAEAVLHRFQDRHGVLLLGAGESMGVTPLVRDPLPMGSYLVILRMRGFQDVRYPVHITRNRHWSGRVRLRTQEEIGDGFVCVPAGPYLRPLPPAISGATNSIVELPDFAVAPSPVTFGDWAAFLAAVEREEGPAAAERLCPSTHEKEPLMERREDRTWHPVASLCVGPARERCLGEFGPGFELRIPVVGVTKGDVLAWCAWRARTTGREWRLPTLDELWKAALGVDGRPLPWGTLADPSLAKWANSRDEPAQPEPVGGFPSATSVYGVIDACGGVAEYTTTGASELMHEFAVAEGVTLSPGGTWLDSATRNIAKCFHAFRADSRSKTVGFRPVRSLP